MKISLSFFLCTIVLIKQFLPLHFVPQTGVTPLPDNDPRDKFMFEVTVFTGFKGKAG